MGYDANRQQPTSMVVDRTNGTDKIIDYAYQYYDQNGNNNGRIRTITDNYDPAYTTTYGYDDYNRLGGASNGVYSRSYTHDPWGNIKNFSGVTFNYATNGSGAPATNRISSDSAGGTFGYDNAGNMISAPGWTYSYDGANRLKQAVGGSGTSTYGYDGDGGRVRQTANGGTPLFYVRSSVLGQVVMEVNSTQGVYRSYVYSGNKLLGERSQDGNFYWLHSNHLGSSRWLTDVFGNAVYRGEFDPYGQAVYEWGLTSLNSRKFTGYERDVATGLDYANARMYSSGKGRFLQPDPMGFDSSNSHRPQTLNRYSYVHNDPANYVDPAGTSAVIWDCVTFRIVINDRWETVESCSTNDDEDDGGGGGGKSGGGRGNGISHPKAFADCMKENPGNYGEHSGAFNVDVADYISYFAYQAGISPGLLAITWGGESNFSFFPNSQAVNIPNVGETVDVGPMQLNVYYT